MTLQRVKPLVRPDRILVVAGKEHARWIREQAPGLPTGSMILEEVGRDTAASIGLSARQVLKRDPGAILITLPADHWVDPIGKFRMAMRRAVRAASATEGLVTLGLKPRSPETGMGYIRPAARRSGSSVRRVERFIEKPDRSKAMRMISGRRWWWNSGIFVWKAATILEALRRHAPRIAGRVSRWQPRARGRKVVPAALMSGIPARSIDRAVLEKSPDVWMIEGTFRWSDVGTWDSLAAIGVRGGRRGDCGWGRIVAVESENCFGVSDAGPIAFVGVQDLIAVRSGPAVLICRRGAGQMVRRVAAACSESASQTTRTRPQQVGNR
jgi:mannose-1-phosphate guanylyltransferase